MVSRRPTLIPRREALARGRDAALAARLAGKARPTIPFNRGTKAAMHWEWGAERAERLFDQIMDIGR